MPVVDDEENERNGMERRLMREEPHDKGRRWR
jgi:hypothetical protein